MMTFVLKKPVLFVKNVESSMVAKAALQKMLISEEEFKNILKSINRLPKILSITFHKV